MTTERAAAIRRNRPRGVYVPVHEVLALLACGWAVMDDACGSGEVLMRPAPAFAEAA
jgi:hypothetical protein